MDLPKWKIPPKPLGGGAAARKQQFDQERGLSDADTSKSDGITKESDMDMQECKVFVPVDFTKEQAEGLVRKYTKDVSFGSFQSKREIGCNVVSFIVATLPIQVAQRMLDEKIVAKIETLTSFKSTNSNAEMCPPGHGG